MSCLINSDPIGTYHLLRNGENILDVSVIQTVDDLMNAFDELNDLDIKSRLNEEGDREYYYETPEGTHVFAHSASDIVKDRFERNRKKYQGATERIVQGESPATAVGNVLHDMVEQATHYFYKNGLEADPKGFWSNYQVPQQYIGVTMGRSDTEVGAIRKSIENAALDVLRDAQRNQAKINERTGRDDKFFIRTEQRLVNPSDDMIGHQDLMVIFSDKTVWDFDYKSKKIFFTRGAKNQLSKRAFGPDRRETYGMQANNYKTMKETIPGLQVTRSVIVPLIFRASLVKKGGKKDGDVTGVEVSHLYTGSDTKASTPIATRFSETTNEEVNKLINELNTQYDNLIEQGKKSFKNAAAQQLYYSKAERLFDIVQALSLSNNAENLMMDSRALFNLVTGNRQSLENMDFATLEKNIADVQLLKTLIEVYNNILAEETSFDNHNKDFVQGVKRAYNAFTNAQAATQLEHLEKELVGERVRRNLGNIDERFRTEIGVNPKITMRDLNFVERWAVAYDYIDNPLIQRVSELNLLQERKALTQYRERSKSLIEKGNAFKSYMKSTFGKGEIAAYEMLVDRKTGKMISEMDPKLFTDLAEAIQNEDLKWIKDNFYIEDEDAYRQRYQEREDALRDVMLQAMGVTKEEDITDDVLPSGEIVATAEQRRKAFRAELNQFRINNDLLSSDRKAWLNYRNVTYGAQIRTETREKFKTQAFREIESHAPMLDFYRELRSVYGELREELGLNHNELPSTFIPGFKSELVDQVEISKLTSSEGWKDIKSWFTDALHQTERDTIQFQDKDNGWTDGAIPVVGMQDIDPNIKSYDLLSSALLFMKGAYLHRHLSDTLPEVRGILDMVKPGSKTMDQYVQITGKKSNKQATEIYNTLENMIGYQWFGRRYKEAKKLDTAHPNLSKIMLSARNYHILTKMGLNFVSAGGAGFGALMRSSFLARAGVAYTKRQWSDTMKEFRHKDTRGKMRVMAEYFNTSAEGQVRRDVRKNIGGTTKAGKMTSTRAWLREEGLMLPWSFGDDQLSHIATGAVGKNYGLDSEGNIIRIELLKKKDPNAKSLWEMFEVDLLKGEIGFNGKMDDDIIQDHTWVQFHKAVRQTMINIIGQLNERELMGIQASVVGTMFTTYRTWVPGVLMGEFGKTQYDYAFRTVKEGRLNTTWKNYVGKGDVERAVFSRVLRGGIKLMYDFLRDSTIYIRKDGIADGSINRDVARREFNLWKAKNPDLALKLGRNQEEQLDHWIDMKERNLNAAFAEMRIVAAMLIVMSVIRLIDLDKDGVPDYKQLWISRQLYRLLNKMTTEVSTPLSPRELVSSTEPQIPTFSIVTNTFKIIANTLDESFDAIVGEDDDPDRSPAFHQTRKEIPVINAFFKIFDQIYDTDVQSDPLLR